MTPEDLEFLDRKVPLLSHFTVTQRRELAGGSKIRIHEAGEILVQAGDELHYLGVVIEGEIAAICTSADGQRVELGKLGPGDTFGEMALMSGDPLWVDFQAASRCRVMCVPLSLFQTRIMAKPEAALLIAMKISQRVQVFNQAPAKAAQGRSKAPRADQLRLSSEQPERILILNCGSSSLKYSLFNTENTSETVRGVVERIGASGTRLKQSGGASGRIVQELPKSGYKEAFEAMLQVLGTAASEVSVVGHRVVHGGEKFTGSVVVDDQVIQEIDKLSVLAPLHNPVNAEGIRAARRLFPQVPHVAVFDTAFHATLPEHAFLYGLPYELYERKGVRRYGFHGSSHAYVLHAACHHLNRLPRELKIISCHLGNGASICAIDHGRSVDTTMGFTTAEGLIMGTRCGDIDPGIIEFLQREEGMTAEKIGEMLNHQSGLLGLSGVSSDMREIEQAADAGNSLALQTIDAFCYRVRKYIGAYVAAMGGVDVLVFTAGIGQNSTGVRATVLQGLDCMGIRLDEQRNRGACGSNEVTCVSLEGSPVDVLVIPADEELMIARESLRTLNRHHLLQTSVACKDQPIPIEVSAHHIHLSQEHVESLFGPGYQLTPHANLSQPGQYACKEQLTIVGPRGRIERVRVLGPTRSRTQVEIAMTEQFKLGLQPPIRESGDIEGSPGCTLEGAAGSVVIDKGVICALRHIHMTPADALRYGVRDKCSVRVRVSGDRELIFGDVRVRVSPNFALAMHIDTDEANAANLLNGAEGYIEGIQNDS